MKIAFFSTKPYDKDFFEKHNQNHELTFFDVALSETSVRLAEGFDGICVFVNDKVNAVIIGKLAKLGIKLIALRCAGFNNVDLEAAKNANIGVVRVPAYSPHAVAEHAVALIMTLNRKTHKAYNRVHEGNFSLEKLIGFDLYQKTVGVIGTGKIGEAFARIMQGFGCKIIAYDVLYRSILRQQELVQMQISDYQTTAVNVFDAAVFKKMTVMENIISIERPEGNPPLKDNSPALLNEIANKLNYWAVGSAFLRQLLEQLKENAVLLIELVQKEYHLK